VGHAAGLTVKLIITTPPPPRSTQLLDITFLVLIVASRMKKAIVSWPCPFLGDEKKCSDIVELEDYLQEAHSDVKVKFLRSKERKKILKRREENILLRAQLERDEAARLTAARQGCVSFSCGHRLESLTLYLMKIVCT
jgi:hypothetical protein